MAKVVSKLCPVGYELKQKTGKYWVNVDGWLWFNTMIIDIYYIP